MPDNALTRPLPRHVAIIMDGNGRWAKARGQFRWEGHSVGARAVRRTVEAAARMGLEHLTLYAFSINNWQRPSIEVEALMKLLTHFAKKEQAELMAQNIRVRVVGQLEALPSGPRKALENLIRASSGNTGMTLNLALSYGGRDDLARAAQRLAQAVARGELAAEEIDEKRLQAELSTAHSPNVDLLIRTGGESRISDFLLFEAAYAELLFLPVMWPEFTEEHLLRAVQDYCRVERRFGLTSAQVDAGELRSLGYA